MFLSELGQVLRRRWYLLVAGAVLAVLGGFLTLQIVPPEYSSSAEVLLLPPGTSVPEGANPYLSLSGLTPAGDVLARALSDPQAAEEVFAAGGTAEYTVALDGDSPAPLVFVEATAPTARDAQVTRDLVLERLPSTLQAIQAAANVPRNAYITTSEVTRTTAAVKETKPQIRALVVVVGGLLTLTLLGTAALDALLRRRRSRRNSAELDDVLASARDSVDGTAAAAEEHTGALEGPPPRSSQTSPHHEGTAEPDEPARVAVDHRGS